MEDLNDLQERARALESSGQDRAALEAYRQLVGRAGDDLGATVWTRMGTLSLRVGEMDEAARALGRAVDLYREAGLPNAAIAICQWMLRADPERAEFHLRFGELSALQRFTRDARSGFAEYARRMERAGDHAAAVAALRSYLRHYPDDREMRAWLERLPGGEASRRPDPAPPPAAPPRVEEPVSGPPADTDALTILDPSGEPSFRAAADPGRLEGTEPEPRPEREEHAGVPTLEGFEPTHADADWVSEPNSDAFLPLLGTESTGADEEQAVTEEPEDDLEPLPLLGFEPTHSAPEPEPEDDGQDDPGDELPILIDPLEQLRSRIARDPRDLDARRDLLERLAVTGPPDELAVALEEALPAFAAAGEHAAAAAYAARLVALRPADRSLLQSWAEYAFRSGDRRQLIAVHLTLAQRFEADDQPQRAHEVYRRVLEMDPGNEQARRALAALAPRAPGEPGGPDRAGMLPAGARESRSERQEAGPPASHPDRAEIVALLRKRALENPYDPASHFDLGLAFKEMGMWDDAISHLQRALRGGSDPVATLEMLGECFVRKGEHELAVRVLDRAVRLPGATSADLTGVYYWLGRSQEAVGAAGPARDSYERVIASDATFRDAASRLAALRTR